MNPPDDKGHKQDPVPVVLEPSARMKQLIETSHSISVDKNIPLSKYFHSGRELIKSATDSESKGDNEKAFVLYLRYMTLFLEKLIHHPEWNKADRQEKDLVKKQCNDIFELAEELKKKISEKYSKEYQDYLEKTKNHSDETASEITEW